MQPSLYHREPDHGAVLDHAVRAYARYSLEYNYLQQKLEMSGVAVSMLLL